MAVAFNVMDETKLNAMGKYNGAISYLIYTQKELNVRPLFSLQTLIINSVHVNIWLISPGVSAKMKLNASIHFSSF